MYTIRSQVTVGYSYEIEKHIHESAPHIKPPWHRKFWNRQHSEVLGRNADSWTKILLFYLAFYAILVVFCAIAFSIFYADLPQNVPRHLQSQPGLLFAPICEQLDKYPYIKYHETYDMEVKCLVECIKTFLSKYGKQRSFGACTLDNNYGYNNRTPCIFLKLTRPLGFKLNAIESANQLPSAAPKELRKYLTNSSTDARKNRAWLSCAVSKEHVKVNYYVDHGIPAKALEMKQAPTDADNFFNENDFQRIVAVQFQRMPVNKVVKIDCFCWAKNIERDQKAFIAAGSGYVQINFHIIS